MKNVWTKGEKGERWHLGVERCPPGKEPLVFTYWVTSCNQHKLIGARQIFLKEWQLPPRVCATCAKHYRQAHKMRNTIIGELDEFLADDHAWEKSR